MSNVQVATGGDPNGQSPAVPPLKTFAMTWWFAGFIAIVVVGLALGSFDTVSSTPAAVATATPAAVATAVSTTVTPASGAAATAGAAVILAIVSAAAIGIERLLEAFWNFIDSRYGGWWPFSLVHDAIDQRVKGFDARITPYIARLESAGKELKALRSGDSKWQDSATKIGDAVTAAKKKLSALATQVDGAKLGNDQKLNYLLTQTSSQINRLFANYPDLHQQVGNDVNLAATLTNDLSSFTATFSDNPARRIISLAAGAVLGYIVALVLKLDLFNALGVASLGPYRIFGFPWSLGVPLTGLIMGLGSNPTHEVIQAIQQFKQNSAQSSRPTST